MRSSNHIARLVVRFARYSVLCLLAGQPAVVRADPPGGLTVSVAGPETMVFSHARDACETWDIPDAPARAVRTANHEVLLFAPHFRNRLLRGPDLLHVHADCRVVFAGAEDDDPADFNDRGWLAAPFTRDGLHIVAVVHNEFQGNRRPALCPSGRYLDCWYNSLTAAISGDGGETFHLVPGLVAALPYRYDEVTGSHRGYFNPSNIVSSGASQFMLIFATEARAQKPGNCLLQNDRPEDPSGWRGWDGAGYAVRFIDPYREHDAPGQHVCTPVGVGKLRWPVTSLVRHTQSGLFIATMMNAAADGGVFYSTSHDMLVWSDPVRLMPAMGVTAWHCGAVAPIAYPSLLDPESSDRSFATIGNHPLLFLTRLNARDCKIGADRDLVRVPLTLTSAE